MIKKPCELLQKSIKVRMILAGFPGIGKTTLALSAPKPLLIDLDRGVNRVKVQHRKDTVEVSTYEELKTDLVPKNLTEYESIIIDTGMRLFEILKDWAIKQSTKNAKKDGSLSIQGYGVVGAEFRRFTDYCFYNLDKNLIIIFHTKEEKDGEDTKLRIDVEGGTKNTIWQSMDIGGFVEMQGKSRTIGFSNCERYFAKGTHGIYGIKEIPELEETTENNFLTKLFLEINKNIADENKFYEEEQAEYKTIMDELLPKIESMEPEDFVFVQELIKQVAHKLTSEKDLKSAFLAKIKELGYKYDKKQGAYVEI